MFRRKVFEHHVRHAAAVFGSEWVTHADYDAKWRDLRWTAPREVHTINPEKRSVELFSGACPIAEYGGYRIIVRPYRNRRRPAAFRFIRVIGALDRVVETDFEL